jgi:hypothetical protein
VPLLGGGNKVELERIVGARRRALELLVETVEEAVPRRMHNDAAAGNWARTLRELRREESAAATASALELNHEALLGRLKHTRALLKEALRTREARGEDASDLLAAYQAKDKAG